MFGTIRKHSSWLWIVIAGLTIISFVAFMGTGQTRNGSGRAGSYGTIYGREVTAEDYLTAQREFSIFYWLHYGEWPEKSRSFNRSDLDRETYLRVLLSRKAESLGVHVSEESVVTAASDLLRSLGSRSGQTPQLSEFVERELQPQGLTAVDFENFVRADLVVQQLAQTLGLAGALVTPQQAAELYDRENQELSAQAVFFSASNYLAQVVLAPAGVAQFYTNNLATYREPDRVQIRYVVFDVTNYLAQAKAEWAKTNFDEYVDAAYRQYGATEFPEARTPDEAKVKIREILVRQRALADARQQANDFAGVLFAREPVKPENLDAVAREKGLAVALTAPFAAATGPVEFDAPTPLIKAAFQLTADDPLAGPIVGQDGVYVIALAQQLPSSIPSLDLINARVTQDYQSRVATELARRAGTNFLISVTVRLATGKSFAESAVAAGLVPVVLSPFSLSSTNIPEVGNRAELGEVKQAAFTTPVGHAAGLVPTADGGFVLFVQSALPLDEAKKSVELPRFLTQVRRARENEAFNLWLQGEANRELRSTPIYQQQMAGTAPAR